jgi:hypothetical protein
MKVCPSMGFILIENILGVAFLMILEGFNEIHLFTGHQYHPQEVPCQNRKSVKV